MITSETEGVLIHPTCIAFIWKKF